MHSLKLRLRTCQEAFYPQKGKDRLSTIHFQVRKCAFQVIDLVKKWSTWTSRDYHGDDLRWGLVMLSNWARGTIDGRNPAITSSYGKYTIIYRASYISGGAGFQPTTGWGTFLSHFFLSTKTISQLSVTKICTCTYLKSKRKTCLARSAVCLEKPWLLTNIKGGSTHTHMLHECHMYLRLP